MKPSSLTTIHSDLERASRAIVSRSEGVEESLWLKRTPPAWSMCQVVMHLTIAAEGGNGALKKKIADYGPKQAHFKPRRHWKQSAAKLLVFSLSKIPFRAEAPKMVRPGDDCEIEKLLLLRRYCSALDDARQMAEAIPDEAHAHVFLPHFAFGDLTLAEWVRFMRIHAEHHARQIDRLKHQFAAPAS